jgi:hypothetical protein
MEAWFTWTEWINLNRNPTPILIMDWTSRLLQFGIPQNLAARMSQDLQEMPYAPEQFSSIQQLVPVMRSAGFESLDWWDDLILIVEQLVKLIPGFVMIGVGAAMAYFLRNVKVSGVPLALVGLVPLGIGTYVVVQPYMPTESS